MALEFIGDWPDKAEHDQVEQTLAFLYVKPDAWKVARCGCGKAYVLSVPTVPWLRFHAGSARELRAGAALFYGLGANGLKMLLETKQHVPFAKTA